jgi:hypothetical protein
MLLQPPALTLSRLLAPCPSHLESSYGCGCSMMNQCCEIAAMLVLVWEVVVVRHHSMHIASNEKSFSTVKTRV